MFPDQFALRREQEKRRNRADLKPIRQRIPQRRPHVQPNYRHAACVRALKPVNGGLGQQAGASGVGIQLHQHGMSRREDLRQLAFRRNRIRGRPQVSVRGGKDDRQDK